MFPPKYSQSVIFQVMTTKSIIKNR